ncbi:hypothetical protein D1647_14070 [Alistipes sp. Z76]|nr:hypothetical protein [Alistipes sp. Z76]NCE69337.1 hypothetical protein [Muribaculaceae bacterium M3]
MRWRQFAAAPLRRTATRQTRAALRRRRTATPKKPNSAPRRHIRSRLFGATELNTYICRANSRERHVRCDSAASAPRRACTIFAETRLRRGGPAPPSE